MLRECRRRIDQQAPPERHQALLAVTQFLARLRFDEEALWEIFGGAETMLEIPFLDKVVEELAEQRVAQKLGQRVAQKRRQDILLFLGARFAPSIPADLSTDLEPIQDESRLDDLIEWAAICPDLDAFRARLSE